MSKESNEKDFYLYDLMTGDLVILFTGMVLGRIGVDVNFNGDTKMSSRHLQVKLADGKCYIMDLGSKNRSRIGPRYISAHEWTELKVGDLLLIGRQKLELTDEVLGNGPRLVQKREEDAMKRHQAEGQKDEKAMESIVDQLSRSREQMDGLKTSMIELEDGFIDEVIELEREKEQFYSAIENIKMIYLKRVDELLAKKKNLAAQRENLLKFLAHEKTHYESMHRELIKINNSIEKKKTGT
jgi:flagellar motility protein MotE (MotC chaperone)